MIRREITDIALQPSLFDLKLHLRITSNDQDAILLPYLKAAARGAEHYIGRFLEDSVFTYTDAFKQTVQLPNVDNEYFPLISVQSVAIDGTVTTDYSVTGGTLVFDEGTTGDAFTITYACGGIEMEPDIKAAIMLTASKYFNNPVDSVETLPTVATNLLSSYRSWDNGE